MKTIPDSAWMKQGVISLTYGTQDHSNFTAKQIDQIVLDHNPRAKIFETVLAEVHVIGASGGAQISPDRSQPLWLVSVAVSPGQMLPGSGANNHVPSNWPTPSPIPVRYAVIHVDPTTGHILDVTLMA